MIQINICQSFLQLNIVTKQTTYFAIPKVLTQPLQLQARMQIDI